jgi:hypothetical protein
VHSLVEAHAERFRQGNGRAVATTLNAAITAHARRTERLAASGERLTTEEMTTLLPEDIAATG